MVFFDPPFSSHNVEDVVLDSMTCYPSFSAYHPLHNQGSGASRGLLVLFPGICPLLVGIWLVFTGNQAWTPFW